MIPNCRIACTGFVAALGGSVASANALLLGALLDAGLETDFFSKPSFVDPRPVAGDRVGFRFLSVINSFSDGLRRKVAKVPVIGALAGRNDAACYNRLLVRRIRVESVKRSYDAVLWLGDYAHGSVPGVPNISFVQGPPGTDARSVLRRGAEVRRLSGKWQAFKWQNLARLRLSPLGLPQFRFSDHFIVGSEQAKRVLHQNHAIPLSKISCIPYPIDLDLFRLAKTESERLEPSLRVLWLGRIVPRKRLDLFLSGAEIAIREGLDVKVTVVGGVGFVKGYEKLLQEFSFPGRLRWIRSVCRSEVPELLGAHDVLAQPSEEENFGSSVAEAQAMGMPVIVGQSNGNGDYLCPQDIHLADDRPETFAAALQDMARRLQQRNWRKSVESRQFAENTFGVAKVTASLVSVIRTACELYRR